MKRSNSLWVKNHSINSMRSEYSETSIFSEIKYIASEYPNNNAIDFYSYKITFGLLIKQIEKMSCYLVAYGVNKGDYISIISPNVPQALISVYAANRIGAIANIIHPALATKEMKTFVENVGSKVVVVYDALFEKIKDVKWNTISQPKIIVISAFDGIAEVPTIDALVNTDSFAIKYSELSTIQYDVSKLPMDDGKADDVAVILYSGGTTGIPKGVMITNLNMNSLILHSRDVYPGSESCVGLKSLALMPIFHGFGLGSCMHSLLCNGVEIVLMPKFDFKECIDAIFSKKINLLFGVPAFYEALSRCEQIEKEDLSFIKVLLTAGDKASQKMMKRIRRQLVNGGSDAFFVEAYGQTECLAGCCVNPFFDMREGNIGIPYSDMEVIIVDTETNEEVKDGECGEICISGPNVMKGYLNNEKATNKALQKHSDGRIWLHSGDVGYKIDGQFYFKQRISRMIITSGYNVFPATIEEIIGSNKEVNQCCVVGVKDRIVGQKIVAVVSLKNQNVDNSEVKKEILDLCKENLAVYSIPSDIIFVDAIPVSPLGKIDFKAVEASFNK